MEKQSVRSLLFLGTAAFIWGTAFVAQSVGMEYIEPFTFSVLRSFLGSAFLLPFARIAGKRRQAGGDKKTVLQGGIVCGIVLFAAVNLQQAALLSAGVGKSGFLTALYIVIVPVMGIFLGKKPGKKLVLAVILAVAGLYLLCVTAGSFSFETGDIFLLLCAASFSVHIMAVDRYIGQIDGIVLSCLQFFVCGILSACCMLGMERPSWDAVVQARFPLLYTGILSSGVAYTFQILGQKGLNPVVASLVMSMESVISALSGWLILGQTLTGREIAGCAVMFAAIVLAQLPDRDRGGHTFMRGKDAQ